MGLGKIAGSLRSERRRGSLLADPARLELLDIATLAGLVSGATGTLEPTRTLRAVAALDHVVLDRELARRTGEPAHLDAAARAVETAVREAGDERRLYAAARLQSALNALMAAELFGGADATEAAEIALGDAEEALNCAPGRLNGPGLVRARLASRRALASLDRDAVLDVVARFDEAAAGLEARLRATGAGEPELAAALCEKAELVIGFASVRKDMGLLDRAARELSHLSSRLDAARLPLSWMRAQTLQGQALRALGEVTGEAKLMKDSAVCFGAAFDAIPAGHSPLDRARAAHGLGLALQGLAEASGEPLVQTSAQLAFERALGECGAAQSPFRAVLAHDRACALVRRAERNGDGRALAEAEAVFRDDLARRPAQADPVGWAVLQLSLARVYVARARLKGAPDELADAAFAITEALEVFADHGQHGLANIAQAALESIRALS